MPYRIQTIDDLAGFNALEEEWNKLLSRSGCDIPFLTHEWFRVWWETFGADRRAVVITARKEGRLVFAMPLLETRHSLLGFRFVTLESMANYHSCRYCFIVEKGEEEAFGAVLEYLNTRADRWHLLLLKEMTTDMPGYELARAGARNGKYRCEVWEAYDSPYLAINGSWNAHLSTLTAKFRSNMRNRKKRLERMGEVRYRTIENPEEVAEAIDAGFRIEMKSWKGTEGTAVLCDPVTADFYGRLSRTMARKGMLQLDFLDVSGVPVAFNYQLRYKRKLYCLKIAYDPEYSACSVGQVLCEDILRKCFNMASEEYDFLGESSTQKLDWMPRIRRQVWLFLYNKRLVSHVHHFMRFRVRDGIKDVVH